MKFSSSIAACALSAAVVHGGPALAQAAQRPATGRTEAAPSDSALAEVVVTARRREESIISAPVAVTALSGDQLRAANVTSVNDLDRIAPSMRMSPVVGRLGTVSVSIRGMSETSGSVSADPAVGIYFADAIQTRAQGAGRSLYDLASIQVLKGPQGTLFGRNLTGGAILIAPEAPALKTFEGYVQGIYGNYSRHELQGAVNLPLGEKVALRIGGNFTRRDGYITNLVTGADLRSDHSDSVRVSLLAEPLDGLRNTLIFDGYKAHGRGGGFVPVAINPAVTSPPNPLAARLAAFQRQQARGIYQVEEGQNSPTSASNYGFTNTTVLDWGGLTFKNIFNYRRVREADLNEDGLALNLVQVYTAVRAQQYTEEFQVIGHALDDKLDYIAGAYYFHEGALSIGAVSSLGTPPRRSAADATNESKSVFAQFDYHFTDQLSVTAGGRYTWDDRDLSLLVIDPSGVKAVDRTVSKTFKRPTWTLSLNYEPTPDTLIYLTNRRGYRSGGFNAGATTVSALTTVQPEILTDYEFGAKSQGSLGSVRYRATLAVYRSNYDQIQRNLVALLGTPPAPTRVLLNAAKAKVSGGEFEATLIPVDILELSGSVGYTNAKYKTFVDPLTGTDLSGLPFSQTPKWTYRLSGRLELPVPEELGQLSLRADYAHTSQTLITDAAILPGYVQPGYGLLSLRLSFDNIAGSGARAALFATNVTKEKHPLGGTPFYGAPFGLTAIVYGEPRMYGVELGYRF